MWYMQTHAKRNKLCWLNLFQKKVCNSWQTYPPKTQCKTQTEVVCVPDGRYWLQITVCWQHYWYLCQVGSCQICLQQSKLKFHRRRKNWCSRMWWCSGGFWKLFPPGTKINLVPLAARPWPLPSVDFGWCSSGLEIRIKMVITVMQYISEWLSTLKLGIPFSSWVTESYWTKSNTTSIINLSNNQKYTGSVVVKQNWTGYW